MQELDLRNAFDLSHLKISIIKRPTDRLIDRPTDRPTDRTTYRPTDGRTDGLIGKLHFQKRNCVGLPWIVTDYCEYFR